MFLYFVDDGNDEPSALKIVQSAVVADAACPALRTFLARVAEREKVGGETVEVERCAEPEFLRKRRRDPPLGEVGKVLVGPSAIEIAKIKAGGVLHQSDMPVPFLLFERGKLGGLIVPLGHFEPRAGGKDLHGLHEVHILVFLHEGDDVPAHPAAETVIIPVDGVDGKGGRLFVVEGTACPIVVSPSLQLDIGTDDIYDVILLLDRLKEGGKIPLHYTLPSCGTKRLWKRLMA